MAARPALVRSVVSDENGKPVSGAVVQLKDLRTLWIRSYISRRTVPYQFAQLDPNVDYELSAAHGNASSPAKTLSKFDERPLAYVNLRLEGK